MIRQAGCTNDHPTFTTFLQLYRMLSMYSLLKPPKFGNCTVLTQNSEKLCLNFEDFKYIFAQKNSCQKELLKNIEDKIKFTEENEDWDEYTLKNLPVDQDGTNNVDYIIYFLAGFICKKIFKTISCEVCKDFLYNKTSQGPVSALTDLKSRGWLNHPNMSIFHILRKIEKVLMNNIKCVDVFDKTVEEIFNDNESFSFFPCTEHKEEIMSKVVLFYCIMRVKQYYHQEQGKLQQKSSAKKKEAKLYSS